MPKRIAIFCDGTWNRPDAPETTNVYKLHKAALQTAPDGITQILKYIPGVGTGFGMTGARKYWDIAVGGAFGTGVTRNILTAYRFLIEHYEPGDHIFIFGFSRGAFTARSLAGLIRASGLPPHAMAHRAAEGLKRYRDSSDTTKPGTPESHAFRLEYSPGVATSAAEQAWRRDNNAPEGHLLTITYLGVWDTVGAMGIPGHYKLLAQIFNRSHGFHDTQLSSSVTAARHAVSIDERRRTFPPTLWGNLDTLSRIEPGKGPTHRQEWFSGDHGSVGGGGEIVGLSNIAMRWVAAGATDQGLVFEPGQMTGFRGAENHLDALHNTAARAGVLKRLLRRNAKDRVGENGPQTLADLSRPAQCRWRNGPEYRPVSLAPFAADLNPMLRCTEQELSE